MERCCQNGEYQTGVKRNNYKIKLGAQAPNVI